MNMDFDFFLNIINNNFSLFLGMGFSTLAGLTFYCFKDYFYLQKENKQLHEEINKLYQKLNFNNKNLDMAQEEILKLKSNLDLVYNGEELMYRNIKISELSTQLNKSMSDIITLKRNLQDCCLSENKFKDAYLDALKNESILLDKQDLLMNRAKIFEEALRNFCNYKEVFKLPLSNSNYMQISMELKESFFFKALNGNDLGPFSWISFSPKSVPIDSWLEDSCKIGDCLAFLQSSIFNFNLKASIIFDQAYLYFREYEYLAEFMVQIFREEPSFFVEIFLERYVPDAYALVNIFPLMCFLYSVFTSPPVFIEILILIQKDKDLVILLINSVNIIIEHLRLKHNSYHAIEEILKYKFPRTIAEAVDKFIYEMFRNPERSNFLLSLEVKDRYHLNVDKYINFLDRLGNFFDEQIKEDLEAYTEKHTSLIFSKNYNTVASEFVSFLGNKFFK